MSNKKFTGEFHAEADGIDITRTDVTFEEAMHLIEHISKTYDTRETGPITITFHRQQGPPFECVIDSQYD